MGFLSTRLGSLLKHAIFGLCFCGFALASQEQRGKNRHKAYYRTNQQHFTNDVDTRKEISMKRGTFEVLSR